MFGEPNASGDSGYSLTEVLVVLALLSLFASLAPPTLNRLVPQFALDKQVSDLQSSLYEIRRDAMMQASVYELELSTVSERFRVMQGQEVIRTGALSCDVARFYGQAGDASIDKTDIVFSAYPDGSLHGPSLFVNCKEATAQLSVSELSGMVRVY